MPRTHMENLHPAAVLILSQVGRGKIVRNQNRLRERAGVGSNKLNQLRHDPHSLDDLSLIRLADAVCIDPRNVFEVLGRGSNWETINRIRSQYCLQPFPTPLGERFYPAPEFFTTLERQVGNTGNFLLAGGFTSPPHLHFAPIVQEKFISLLQRGMCYAMYVPLACYWENNQLRSRGGNRFLTRYQKTFQWLISIAKILLKSSPASDQERIAEQIAIFVLHESLADQPELLRLVLPHDDEEQKFLIQFQPSNKKPAPLLAALWRHYKNFDQPPLGWVEVIYDSTGDSVYYANPKYREHLEDLCLQEYFQYAIQLWEAGETKKFAETEEVPDKDRLWQKLPSRLITQGLL